MRCPNCLATGLPLVLEVTAPRTVRFAVDDGVAVAAGGEPAVRLFDSRSGEHWAVKAVVQEQPIRAQRQFVDCPRCGQVDCEVVLPHAISYDGRVVIINPEAG